MRPRAATMREDVASWVRLDHRKMFRRLTATRRRRSSSFLVLIVVDLVNNETLTQRFHEPLVGVRIRNDIGGRVVCNDVVNEVFRADVFELVRLSGRENEI